MVWCIHFFGRGVGFKNYFLYRVEIGKKWRKFYCQIKLSSVSWQENKKKKRKKKFLFNMALIHCLQTNIIKFYFITRWYAFGQCQFMKKERHLTILRRSSCLTFCLFEQYVIVRRFVISLMFWNTSSLNLAKSCIDTFFHFSSTIFEKKRIWSLVF